MLGQLLQSPAAYYAGVALQSPAAYYALEQIVMIMLWTNWSMQDYDHCHIGEAVSEDRPFIRAITQQA